MGTSGLFIPGRTEIELSLVDTTLDGEFAIGDFAFNVDDLNGIRRGDKLRLDADQIVTVNSARDMQPGVATPRITVDEASTGHLDAVSVEPDLIRAVPSIVHEIVVDLPEEGAPSNDLINLYDQESIVGHTPVLDAANLRFDLRPYGVAAATGRLSFSIPINHRFTRGLIVNLNPYGNSVSTLVFTPLGRKNVLYALNR